MSYPQERSDGSPERNVFVRFRAQPICMLQLFHLPSFIFRSSSNERKQTKREDTEKTGNRENLGKNRGKIEEMKQMKEMKMNTTGKFGNSGDFYPE